MSENYDEIMDMVREAIEEASADMSTQLTAEIQDVVAQAVNETLSEMEFRLSDGTVISPAPRLKLLCSDRQKMLCCYGGLRVDKCKYNGGPEGYALWVQTRACSWDIAAFYEDSEAATEALLRVKGAMEGKLEFFEL